MRKPVKYRKGQQSKSLFEEESTLESLSKMGNTLEFIADIVIFFNNFAGQTLTLFQL